ASPRLALEVRSATAVSLKHEADIGPVAQFRSRLEDNIEILLEAHASGVDHDELSGIPTQRSTRLVTLARRRRESRRVPNAGDLRRGDSRCREVLGESVGYDDDGRRPFVDPASER